jgi:alpha-ketoglutarate-dependent 2,4-dichlorophenoxyacetate dioxygenase
MLHKSFQSACVASKPILSTIQRRTLATISNRSFLQATPLSERFGAQIDGVDFSKPLAPEVAAEIVQHQNRWGVLVFRETGLDDDGHVQYSRNFGELETAHAVNKPRRASSPHLYDAGNLDPEGNIIPQYSRAWWHAKGNGLWHTDSSFKQLRSSYSALRAVELPPGGGQTMYADMRAAYADLPADIKGDIEGKIVEHWIWHSRKLAAPQEFDKPTEAEKRMIPPAYHQLVQMAPDETNKTLYIASHARRIIGMPQNESTQLLKYLLDHAQQSKYQLAMKWKNVGDLIQWDNRCTMHRATGFKDQVNRRDMRRTTVMDNGPRCFGERLNLTRDDVDVLQGGSIDISAIPPPETQTQEQCQAM